MGGKATVPGSARRLLSPSRAVARTTYAERMGVRAVSVAVLLVTMVGCTSGSTDGAGTVATASTVASSLASPATTPPTSSVATSTTSTLGTTPITTVPFDGTACVPVPAEYGDADPPSQASAGVSGPLRVSFVGDQWALADGHVWVGSAANGAPEVAEPVPPSGSGDPTALVHVDPTCERLMIRGGPELLTLGCGDQRFLSGVLPGPCWVSRHDSATGEVLMTTGPYTEVFDVRWAGNDVVLRTIDRLAVPARGWVRTGEFLITGSLEGTTWGVDGAVYQMHQDNTLHRYDLDGGATVSRRVNSYDQRVLGVHDSGLLVERRLTDQPPSYELAVWDPDTLEESSVRPVSGPATLLDTGEVVAQHARGGEIGWEPFTTDLWLHDVATGEETLIASVDENIAQRSSWPTYRPRAILDGALVLGRAF